jgi:hypothetical protein
LAFGSEPIIDSVADELTRHRRQSWRTWPPSTPS